MCGHVKITDEMKQKNLDGHIYHLIVGEQYTGVSAENYFEAWKLIPSVAGNGHVSIFKDK